MCKREDFRRKKKKQESQQGLGGKMKGRREKKIMCQSKGDDTGNKICIK